MGDRGNSSIASHWSVAGEIKHLETMVIKFEGGDVAGNLKD